MIPRPTWRAVGALGAGSLLAALPALVHPALWPAWACWCGLVAAAFVVDAARTPGRRGLTPHLELPPALHVGQAETARLTLEGLDRAEVLLETSAHLIAPPLEAGAGPTWSIPLRPVRRGPAEVEAVWVRIEGPMGLARRALRLPVEVTRQVLPDVVGISGAGVRFRGRRDDPVGGRVERFRGQGSEFEALREFAQGMDTRSIDWKSSARHTKLLAREHRAERDHQVVLAIDVGRRMAEPLGGIARLDHAARAALRLAWVSLKQGDRVGMFAFGERVHEALPPRGGLRTFGALMGMASRLAYTDEETNYTLALTDLLGRRRRRALVVVLTDFSDTVGARLLLENLGRLSKRHLVLFAALRDPALEAAGEGRPRDLADVRRAVVADGLVQERERVLIEIRRMGALAIDVPPDALSAQLITRYLEVARREMIA